ncbi:MAG: hypothetical protein ACR2FU_07775 [Streptosporangiaceae bacterium]
MDDRDRFGPALADGTGRAGAGSRRAGLDSRRRPWHRWNLLPRTVQLCVHCRANPAGFWVSGVNAAVVRRPWCLPCCDGLDLAGCEVTPFRP